jgi:hypothetical protein
MKNSANRGLFLFDEGYRAAIAKKWAPVLEAGNPIEDQYVRECTAMLMENAQNEHTRHSMLMETYSGDGMTNSGVGFGTGSSVGATDIRVPTIAVPMLRRMIPELVAHELCGVQPINTPVSYVFALRYEYGKNRQFNDTLDAAAGTEIAYNNLLSDFAGASGTGVGSYSSTSADEWAAFAGGPGAATGVAGGSLFGDGQGATLANSEWASLADGTMPRAQFTIKKGVVEAKTRKLGASWSLEAAEDMANMHGLNLDNEMNTLISYEVKAEIDREILGEMVRSSIQDRTTSTWSAVSADGRNQIERIGTLFTHLLDKSQQIALKTRRGAGNFVVASPKVVSLLQRIGMVPGLSDAKGIPGADTSSNAALARVGTLSSNHALYRDTFAGGDYMLVGYKGKNPQDNGVIYCPYVPLQLFKTVGPDDGNPRIGARSRDGLVGATNRPEGWNAGYWYQFVRVAGLTSALSSDSSGNRVFTY